MINSSGQRELIALLVAYLHDLAMDGPIRSVGIAVRLRCMLVALPHFY